MKVMTSLCCSKNAVFDNKKAVRGGIPVVFRKYKIHCYALNNIFVSFGCILSPIACFGAWDLGPQHGFARISKWTCTDGPAKVSYTNRLG